jgi:hypothetical protein
MGLSLVLRWQKEIGDAIAKVLAYSGYMYNVLQAQ